MPPKKLPRYSRPKKTFMFFLSMNSNSESTKIDHENDNNNNNNNSDATYESDGRKKQAHHTFPACK